VVPDRLFWAQPDAGEADDDEGGDATQAFDLPAHDTKH